MVIAEQRRVIGLAILTEIIQQNVAEINASNFAIHVVNSDNREGPREFSGIEDYVEYVNTGYTDPYFKKHFRMSRQSFEVRQENISNDVF
jgi:hypothetical protein